MGTSLIWSCVCHSRACGNPAGDTSCAAAHLVSLLSVLRLLVAILTVVSSSIASELTSPIDTPKDAISQTFTYIGVDKKLQIIKEISDPVVTLLTMAESLTPFLSSTVIGRKAWKLDFEKLIFSAKGYELLQSEIRPMTMTVIVDSATGRLFKVSLVVINDSGLAIEKPSDSSAEKQLAAAREIIIGFPDANPAISFLEALKKCYGDFLSAREIEADYIQHSHLQSPTRDVWSIHLYGLPPRPVRPGSDIPVEQRNHMRTVIDANTGQILFSTNLPQPVEY